MECNFWKLLFFLISRKIFVMEIDVDLAWSSSLYRGIEDSFFHS